MEHAYTSGYVEVYLARMYLILRFQLIRPFRHKVPQIVIQQNFRISVEMESFLQAANRFVMSLRYSLRQAPLISS